MGRGASRLKGVGRWVRLSVAAVLVLSIALIAGAGFPAKADAAAMTQAQIDAKAKKIDKMIMAPCCWTQPVSDHYSGVASEIRHNVRKMVAEGKSQQQILDFYVAKYGERILSMPKAEGFNLMAYVLPALALLAGAVVVRAVIRAWNRPAPVAAGGKSTTTASSDDYARRLEEELKARE